MKKLMLTLPLLAGLSTVHPAVAAMDGNDIISLGYAQQHSNRAGTLHGFRLGDNHAFADNWGLNTSASWTMKNGGDNGESNLVSLLTGPSYQINDMLGLYTQVGPAFFHENAPGTKWGYGYGAGFQITPREDINITVGYEGASFDSTHTSGSLDTNGWNLGVGYRF
ncbi:TPA: outer membrane beta-barrel protein [Salmonella enterica]|nr:outer membrane beta-barrel protein [Salmonella enterica subsp. enterica serovar Montevideo]MCH5723047.1 outer membrane beta-barrel protein [Salmonella enterica]EGH0794864.1 outer membrane beta-barrel protein [Salmonella enterica subsp. enterica serovar Montevideo]EJT8386348.1 outer membrane beta-barrel protein [Salmonella enterica subsp. enterica serovar Montevideo]ELM0668154.1 outer membrane beta-barrel protein [Salmonella enterica subsp. enterica serovar Montevideo]